MSAGLPSRMCLTKQSVLAGSGDDREKSSPCTPAVSPHLLEGIVSWTSDHGSPVRSVAIPAAPRHCRRVNCQFKPVDLHAPGSPDPPDCSLGQRPAPTRRIRPTTAHGPEAGPSDDYSAFGRVTGAFTTHGTGSPNDSPAGRSTGPWRGLGGSRRCSTLNGLVDYGCPGP